jgi:hypothetical protein
MSRTLTILLCQTREIENTLENLKENVLLPLRSDLACCSDEIDFYKNSVEIQNNFRYKWLYKEPTDWATAFDKECESKSWRKVIDSGVAGGLMGGVSDDRVVGSGGIIMFYREILRKFLYQSDALETYDWFVITRSDFFWTVPHPGIELLDENQIYFLDGEKYNGVSDRHIIFHKKYAEKISNIAYPLFHDGIKISSDIIEYLSQMQDKGLGPEAYILMRLKQMGLEDKIRFLPYIGYTIRSIGGNTRWSQGVFHEKKNIYIKYPREFLAATLGHFLLLPRINWSKLLYGKLKIRLHVYDFIFRLSYSRYQRKVRPIVGVLIGEKDFFKVN